MSIARSFVPTFAFEQDDTGIPGLDFDDIRFCFESLVPALSEYRALEEILEFTRMGLGMAGDKNNDGRLEYSELEEYFVSMRGLCQKDQQLLSGLKILMNTYRSLAGAKGHVDEVDLFERSDTLLSFIVTEILTRPNLATVSTDKVEQLLSYQLVHDSNKERNFIIERLNNALMELKSVYRIELDEQFHVALRKVS
jgi:hypothetical protein